jgi:ketosteroid isomerase-like protein
LVHGLIRSDKTNRLDHLFVLVGRRTFSAAMNGAVDIERNTNSIFVGEPTGSSPNFVGENTILTLPCSSLRVSCSSLSWQRSLPMDRRTWIEPEIVAEPSMVAFAANRDPGLEAIFAHLDAQSDISMTGTIVFNETSSNAAQTIGSSREQGEGEAAKTMAAAKATVLRQIVEERNRRVIEDFKKGDMHAVARSYADDATIYFAQGQHVHGRQAIDRYWQAVKGAKDWKLEALEVGGTSEAIYEIGKSTLTTKTNGEDNTYVCDYVVIWKRQKDGTYRTHTDIFN